MPFLPCHILLVYVWGGNEIVWNHVFFQLVASLFIVQRISLKQHLFVYQIVFFLCFRLFGAYTESVLMHSTLNHHMPSNAQT